MTASRHEEPAGRLSPESVRARAARAEARGRHFVRGPLPMPWLERAARLLGEALAVGLLLWFRRGIRPREPAAVTPALLARFGVGRKAGYRALAHLEAAGLARVTRSPGRSARAEVVFDGPPAGCGGGAGA